MTTLQLTLPWPPTALSPNARQHWSALSRAKKAYRHACAITARQQGAGRTDAKKLHVSLVFVPPTRRAYDLDNLLARMKSGLDGLADVLGVDDKHWSLTIAKADEVGGMVRVEVSHG
ncbi:endonuclease [Acidovorax sp. M14]|uniref:endonuclease n=1 Tax=Acidovorax sp. M14 TaxID=3411354 RepID=UPI003BF50D9E